MRALKQQTARNLQLGLLEWVVGTYSRSAQALTLNP